MYVSLKFDIIKSGNYNILGKIFRKIEKRNIPFQMR